VTMRLGQTSSTGDVEGEKQDVSDAQPTKAEIEAVLQQFVGDIMQTPPAYSAIKINGQRAYKLARAGKEVTIEPRPVHIETIALDSYEYPFAHFTAHVSSGTYIRSLVEDAGKVLGTGAYMSDLRRTKVGGFGIEKAIPMEQITLEIISTLAFEKE
jgi:tRNA pseudouridine55 synthase